MISQEDFVLSNVTVHVHNGIEDTEIIKDITLHIKAGDWISVVGHNGSGKSTLAQLLTGVHQPHSGFIQRGFCCDQPIPYVMQQEEQFFGETPWDDIVFMLESRGEDAELIHHLTESALHSVGLGQLMQHPLSELSGGQKQLSAVAGCLAAKAPLLLFDEATSMLDTASRIQVLEAAKSVNKQGTTVIWVTHHMEELAAGNRVIALSGGNIVYDGSTSSFFYGFLPAEGAITIQSQSPCEVLGFTLPYSVQVAHELLLLGTRLHPLPLTAEQLIKAVSGDVR